jgi:hypothetical protein
VIVGRFAKLIGALGTSAAKIETTSDITLKPTEFLAVT